MGGLSIWNCAVLFYNKIWVVFFLFNKSMIVIDYIVERRTQYLNALRLIWKEFMILLNVIIANNMNIMNLPSQILWVYNANRFQYSKII